MKYLLILLLLIPTILFAGTSDKCCENCKEELYIVSKQLEDSNQIIEALSEKVEKLQFELNTYKDSYSNLKKKYDSLKEENKKLKTRVDELKRLGEQLTSSLEESTKVIENLKKTGKQIITYKYQVGGFLLTDGGLGGVFVYYPFKFIGFGILGEYTDKLLLGITINYMFGRSVK